MSDHPSNSYAAQTILLRRTVASLPCIHKEDNLMTYIFPVVDYNTQGMLWAAKVDSGY
jgi:hypothetical protein